MSNEAQAVRIERFDLEYDRREGTHSIEPWPAGEYVRFADHEAKLRAANERMAALKQELRVIHEDAESYGVALNDAGWEFNDAMPRYTGANTTVAQFNFAKDICRDVILRYLEKCQKLATNQDTPA